MAAQYSSKKDFVYKAIQAEIIEGRIAGNERLIIEDLAARYKVSPIPVREALQLLAADGLVTFRPHAGATVRAITVENIGEVFDLLEAVETLSAKAACKNLDNESLAELRAMVFDMDELAAKPEEWSIANFAFHERIALVANYRLSAQLMERIRVHWDRIRRRFFDEVFSDHLALAQREHHEILEALEARDPYRLSLLLRQHNRTVRDAYEKATIQ